MACSTCGDPTLVPTARNKGNCTHCRHKAAARASYHRRNTPEKLEARRTSKNPACTVSENGKHFQVLQPDGTLRCSRCGWTTP